MKTSSTVMRMILWTAAFIASMGAMAVAAVAYVLYNLFK